MVIRFEDGLDLKKIEDSGQCFRVKELSDGVFRFVHKDRVLYIRGLSDRGEGFYDVSADSEEWEDIWFPYFDGKRNYAGIRQTISEQDDFLRRAAEYGKGIRVLCQDPWEMLITFITSQRKNIPAIKKSVELICERFGRKEKTEAILSESDIVLSEEIYLFPSPGELRDATDEDLRLCKLGYRAPYILDAINKVLNGDIDLCKLNELDDVQLFESLKIINGVGDKVSNCICLFGYGRMGLVPVDTWIARIINLEYNGKNVFLNYEDNGGIMQQWAFYYERETGGKALLSEGEKG